MQKRIALDVMGREGSVAKIGNGKKCDPVSGRHFADLFFALQFQCRSGSMLFGIPDHKSHLLQNHRGKNYETEDIVIKILKMRSYISKSKLMERFQKT